jgi:hypothetical protein
MARPSKLSKTENPQMPAQRLAAIGIDAICDEISQGKSLHAWCVENGMKNMTVTDWINADKDRAVKYARARDERSDTYFESLGEVGEQAVRAETAVEVAGLRLKADNIKWMLARMSPRKYGDKLAIGGADDLPPVHQDITAAMTPQDAARAYADLMNKKP